MSDWTAGYVTDIDYTHGYYPELNPLRVRLALLGAGWACRDIRTACELGYGQGLSVNLHAAAGGAVWTGTDFNPAHAAGAQELAAASGSGARLFDDAFAEFVQRTDLPTFDFIGLHGIWSWVSDANRAVIVDFVRRHLAVGGVLYLSYNTLPGWAGFAPMRHLMVEHARVVGSQGAGIVGRVDAAIGFAERLLATEPAFARGNPQLADRLKRLKEQNRRYLAHEYFNRDWHPMHFSTVAERLETAKLQFAGSAHLLDQIDGVNLKPEQRALLRECTDPVFRESVRDFMVNQQFRRDLWIRGARRLSPLEQREALAGMRLVLAVSPQEVQRKVTTALGPATLNAAVLDALLEALAGHGVRSLGDLEQRLAPRGVAYANLVEMVFILVGAGHLQPAQDEVTIEAARPAALRLNASLVAKARSSAETAHLASPVTGGGVPVGRIHQLFLAALASGPAEPDRLAESVWRILSAQGERMVKDGQRIDGAAENQTELARLATDFIQHRLPALKALEVVPA
jgi:SAM-dependent methyltransferase